MNLKNVVIRVGVLTAMLGMILPTNQLLAANIHAATQNVRQVVPDVELHQNILTVQCLSSTGTPQDNELVVISQSGVEVARAKTDKQGVFKASILKNGVYEVRTASSTNTVRVWDSSIAPPKSQRVLTVVSGNTLRGQASEGASFNGALIGLGVAGITVGSIIVSESP